MEFKISEMTPTTTVETKPTNDNNVSEDFQFTLRRIGNDDLAVRLEKLIADITVQGDKISKHMDIRDMRMYRAMISDFINEVVTNSYHFSRENYLNRRGRHVVYSMVKLVNKELDELAQELLKNEKNHISILDRIGDIHGLLLDMLI